MAENWREIADSEVDPESPVATTLAQAWRDNPEGIAAGVAGAPRVKYAALDLSNDLTQGDIANSAIGQGELKTSTATESIGSGGGTSIRNISVGQYGFYPEVNVGTAGDVSGDYGVFIGRADWSSDTWQTETVALDTSVSFESYVTLRSDGGDSNVGARVRFVQASPPYDLGDGECGLFLTVDIKNGQVFGCSISPDPVWANSGPTNIRPDYTDKKTGKKYKRIKRPQWCREDLESGRCDLDELIAAKREAPVEDVEITPAYKNADMDLFPHSWVSPPQGTICMLDPVQTHDLLMLHEDGEDIADLLHKGFILPGDEVSRHGPPGVKMISFKWKRSKK